MSVRCDFCSDTGVVWRYPCEDFELEVVMIHASDGQVITLPWGSEGDWAACETCSMLIESERWQSLAQRGVNTSPALKLLDKKMVEGDVTRAVLKLHTEFRRHRTGERSTAL